MSIFACLSKAESTVQQALANEWNAVPAQAKSELLVILQATNIIKANGSLNGDQLLSLITQATGQTFVDSWLTIVDKVATSIGIEIPEGSTPVQVVELISSNLAPRSGDNWADTALRIAAYSLSNLIPGGAIVREIAIPLVQWVYDNVFKPAVTVSTVPAIVSDAAALLAKMGTVSAPVVAPAVSSNTTVVDNSVAP